MQIVMGVFIQNWLDPFCQPSLFIIGPFGWFGVCDQIRLFEPLISLLLFCRNCICYIANNRIIDAIANEKHCKVTEQLCYKFTSPTFS